MHYPKCPECGVKTARIVMAQRSPRVIGFLCTNGHYIPTAYGSSLLKKDLPERKYEALLPG
jgi:hypothetical protein